jgi:radical SAM superfamily enzyme YgiQ (UPF0313 family)
VDAVTDPVSYPRYEGDVYRPPSEADSLILQVMYGCSHGDCCFCGMYTGKRFRVRPTAEVKEDIERLAPWVKERVRKVFLCDGDALVLLTRSLVSILDLLSGHLPRLERVSAYANAHSLMRKSVEELGELCGSTASGCSTWAWSLATRRLWRPWGKG